MYAQVAARLAAAGRNRTMWPPVAQDEVAALEGQVNTLKEKLQQTSHSLQETVQQLQVEKEAQSGARQQLEEVQDSTIYLAFEARFIDRTAYAVSV